MRPVQIPVWEATAGHVAALRDFRPLQRPLLIINVYLHANDAFLAASLLQEVLQWAARLGEQFCITGDYNIPKCHWPIADALAAGALCDADCASGDPEALPGTHRNPEGVLTGHVIDFMLHVPALHVACWQQCPGVDDHDLVHYGILVANQPEKFAWPAMPMLSRLRLGMTFGVAPRTRSVRRDILSKCLHLFLLRRELGPNPRGPSVRCLLCIAVPPLSSHWWKGNCADLPGELASSLPATPPTGLQPLFSDLCVNLLLSFPHLQLCPGGRRKPPNTFAILPMSRQKVMQRPAFKDGGLPLVRVDLGLRDGSKPQFLLSRPGRRSSPGMPHDARDALQSLWSPPELPQAMGFEAVHQLLDQRDEWGLEPVAAADILARAKASSKKSVGLDGWGANALALLGLPACQCVAQLWQACLAVGALPDAWLRVRVALLPKPEGGLRPISVASACYRIRMTCALRNCKTWLLSWADPAMFGGIPGRSAAGVHDLLFADLRRSRTRHGALVGAKQDLKKCFDTVQWGLAFRVWESLGAPRSLVRLLRYFYSHQCRWVVYRGHASTEPILPRRGLLQGCPASMALLNGLMLLWCRYVRLSHPGAQLATFVDDRTVWHTGRNAASDLLDTLGAAAEADRALALQVHPDKRACWATRPQHRAHLAHHEPMCGPVCDTFKLLGLRYKVSSDSGVIEGCGIQDVIARRTRRIGLAAHSLFLRRGLLASTVISTFSWMGPWVTVAHTTAQGWARSLESAVSGNLVSARSRFLLWAVWGRPHLRPKFALAWAAVAHELRRVARNLSTPCCPQLESAMQVLGWTRTAAGVFVTPYGEFLPGFVSPTTAKAAAEDSWLRQLWAQDPKSAGPLPPDLHFSLAFQRREARFWGCRGHRRRVLHAAAHDTRTLERMHLPFHPCPCGEALPSRTHVTFPCPVLADQSLAGRTEAEQRLLVQLLTGLPSPEWAMPDVSQELLLALSTARSVQGRLLVATDGSSLQDTAQPSMYWFSHASFGIAFSLQSKFSGPVPGLDRTLAAAERYALLVVAHAAAILEAPVLILTDNQALSVSFLHAARATSSQLGGYWRHVFSLLPANSSCVWVPAHDRHSEWLCPVAGLTADEARALNRAADEAPLRSCEG